MIRKIAITGPESTGKSMLAAQLAVCYKTFWVPEYAREYLENLGHSYQESDILAIAKGQMKNEQSGMKKANNILFCDTEPIVTKIWSEVKFQHCHPWILRAVRENPYDLYLLCNIDLPWEYDPLRECPDRRQFLFDLFVHELESTARPYRIISGTGIHRMNNAMNAIDQLFHANA